MANINIPDPQNVPGSEGVLPATDRGFRDDPGRDDPAAVGVDDDGTNEAVGLNPLAPQDRPTAIPDLDEPSHLMNHIPDPEVSDGGLPTDPA